MSNVRPDSPDSTDKSRSRSLFQLSVHRYLSARSALIRICLDIVAFDIVAFHGVADGETEGILEGFGFPKFGIAGGLAKGVGAIELDGDAGGKGFAKDEVFAEQGISRPMKGSR